MLPLLADFGSSTSRRMTQAGDLLGLAGAIFLVLSALPFFRRTGVIVGGVLLAGAFVLIGATVHWGVSPYLK